MNLDGIPRVFSPGDVTICANQQGLCLYVGHLQVGFIRKLCVNSTDGKTEMLVTFATSHDVETQRSIEESIRLVRTLPWILVSQ